MGPRKLGIGDARRGLGGHVIMAVCRHEAQPTKHRVAAALFHATKVDARSTNPYSIEGEAVVLEGLEKIWVVRLNLFLLAIDGLVRFEDRPVGQLVSESRAVADAGVGGLSLICLLKDVVPEVRLVHHRLDHADRRRLPSPRYRDPVDYLEGVNPDPGRGASSRCRSIMIAAYL